MATEQFAIQKLNAITKQIRVLVVSAGHAVCLSKDIGINEDENPTMDELLHNARIEVANKVTADYSPPPPPARTV